ncbi:hypothetical protein JTE90_017221 [Oedothorax gibbosus]|uniref:Solute carrier family 13 member 5 n=1 Tax=Oedothorax gibbosus TaxID=931172 RepID=A0AAV6VDK2_9ARAC|nr:hypothetical protein JTE90_017221 [Oedothorax gibbosus]
MESIRKLCSKRLFSAVASVALGLALLPLALSPHKEWRCAFVIVWVAGMWLLEPVPVAATALLPVVLFPVLGIASSAETTVQYMKETYMMFLGGLMVAIAVEECKLHERIALRVLLFVGTDIKWLMLGFMLTTMVLSMWVSNTATTAMMVPIVHAVMGRITAAEDIPMHEGSSLTESKHVFDTEEENKSVGSRQSCDAGGVSSLRVALLLSICYSANIGGTGTLTGTGPNIILKGMLEELHPGSTEVTFATWLLYNVPGMVLCVFMGWIYLWMVYVKCSNVDHNLASKEDIHRIISQRYKKLGSPKCNELTVIGIFLMLVLLWIFREPKFVSGWAELLGVNVGDSVPAIGASFLLFMIPAGGAPILKWQTVQQKLPWGVILLTGGGFALAHGAQVSGLSSLVGERLASLSVLPPTAIITVLCLMTAAITEVVSNSTAATILLPVLSQMALSIGVNPLSLMLPVTVSCSYAFMLPVATPPNAIAFESGGMTTAQMAKPGIVMNVVCCAVQIFMVHTLGVAIFDLGTFPNGRTKPLQP